MPSAITISLAAEARRGPFVYHCPGPTGLTIAEACGEAARLGFDAVEIFPADAAGFPRAELEAALDVHGLAVAAVGTGAGWLRHGLSLTDPDPTRRAAAVEFSAGIVAVAAAFGAPAIIGSMQGRSGPACDRDAAVGLLAESLRAVGQVAAAHGQLLLYEPLNRYETDLFNCQAEAAAFLDAESLPRVKLLCDLFHMSVEEADLAAAIVAVGSRVGHIHWADSNRRAMGLGHTAAGPIAAALATIGFAGYLSGEVLPLPTAAAAARATIESIRRHIPTP